MSSIRYLTQQKKTKFKALTTVDFSKLQEGDEFEIPECDDYEYVNDRKSKLYFKRINKKEITIDPLHYLCSYDPNKGEVKVLPTDLIKNNDMLEDFHFTAQLQQELDTFFKKQQVYKDLGIFPKRGLLLSSAPGMGKTSSIKHFCMKYLQDGDTAIITMNTDNLPMSNVSYHFSEVFKYAPETKRLLLIIEDIGGNERNEESISDLLNFLDGADDVYKIPTFIIATTNFIGNMTSTLADRPGRFDKVIEIEPPSYEQKIRLLEFFAKRELLEEERHIFMWEDCKDLTVSYLREIVLRSKLNDTPLKDVVKEIIAYRKRQQKKFEKQSKFGFNRDDE